MGAYDRGSRNARHIIGDYVDDGHDLLLVSWVNTIKQRRVRSKLGEIPKRLSPIQICLGAYNFKNFELTCAKTLVVDVRCG
jgi:hypothetical protein